MGNWSPARTSQAMAIAGVLLGLAAAAWVVRARWKFDETANLASILGFVLTILTLGTVAVAAAEVNKTLRSLSKRLILGDVARIVTLAEEFRRLCHRSEWQHASPYADALQSALSRLGVASGLLADEQIVARQGAMDMSLVSERLRNIISGAPPHLDPQTWRTLDKLIRRLAQTEGRLRDLSGEATDA